MELGPLQYWFAYEDLSFDTLFYWGRVALIITLIWWLLRRHRIRRREREERQIIAAGGLKIQEDGEGVKDLVGKLVDKVRGEKSPEVQAQAPDAVRPPAPDDADLLLLDKLPEPTPGRCHLVFLNEDGTWVDITVQNMDQTLAMVGQKLLAATRMPGIHIFTITPRKSGAPTKVSVSAKDCYCLVELEAGQVKQICSEHGPIAYDKLKV